MIAIKAEGWVAGFGAAAGRKPTFGEVRHRRMYGDREGRS